MIETNLPCAGIGRVEQGCQVQKIEKAKFGLKQFQKGQILKNEKGQIAIPCYFWKTVSKRPPGNPGMEEDFDLSLHKTSKFEDITLLYFFPILLQSKCKSPRKLRLKGFTVYLRIYRVQCIERTEWFSPVFSKDRSEILQLEPICVLFEQL